ncbi:MAG: hypothetical protein KME50_33820 [Nostoc desertorum CM1-VF14]|jgi:hypothetical protein|nr:hypothetical protein [Nostoc desertorum CM1-VF14]
MATKFTTTHEISGDQSTFWNRFFNKDKDFITQLYIDHLGYSQYTLLEQNESETEIFRRVVIAPKLDLPGPVIKMLGSDLKFIEEGKFVKETQVWYSKKIPSTLANQILWEETIRIESIGDNTIQRIIEATLEAKIFGAGQLLEASFEQKIRQEADKSAEFLNKL